MRSFKKLNLIQILIADTKKKKFLNMKMNQLMW